MEYSPLDIGMRGLADDCDQLARKVRGLADQQASQRDVKLKRLRKQENKLKGIAKELRG